MKKHIRILPIIYITCLIALNLSAQDITASLNEAKTAYKSGSLDDARFALEQSVQQIDQAIGKEILQILPTEMSGLGFHEDQDNVVGTSLGFAGLFVDRNYGEGAQSANIEIIGDSPLMAGLNAILAMPAIMTSGDPNQKRIKVDGYKSILQKETNAEGIDSYSVMIPANSTLISFKCLGFDENQAISMANNIPVSAIVKLAQ